MTKIAIHNGNPVRKDGRKIVTRFDRRNLSLSSLQGVLESLGEDPTDDEVNAALEAAALKRGSVIPDHYRYQYGSDQNCGDQIAKVLTAAATKTIGKTTCVDLDAAREIAATNGVEDRFDVWMAKDLNPGMVRMNLGNVLRGMNRRGEEVRIGEQVFAPAE